MKLDSLHPPGFLRPFSLVPRWATRSILVFACLVVWPLNGHGQRLFEVSSGFPARGGFPPPERLSHEYGPIIVPRSGRLTMTVTASPNVRQEVMNLTREDSSVKKIWFDGEAVNLAAAGFPECNAFGSNPSVCTSVWDSPSGGSLSVEVLQSGVWNIWGEFSSPAQDYTLTVDFEAGPVVVGITPDSGSAGGHTQVRVSGQGFREDAMVLFDEVAATDVVVIDQGTLTCTAPPGLVGGAEITVLNPDPDRRPWNYGRPWGLFGRLAGQYAYTPAPPSSDPLVAEQYLTTVAGFFPEQASVLVDPNSKQQFEEFDLSVPGSGRLRFETWAFIPITGPTYGGPGDELNFEAFNDSSAVRTFVGGDGLVRSTSTECGEIAFVDEVAEHYDAVICQSVDVFGAAAAGQGTFKMWGPARLSALFNDFRSAPYQYYAAGVYFAYQPVVTGVDPSFGTESGGSIVTIRGEHFGTGAQAFFGDVAAANVTVLDKQTLTCTVPPKQAGAPATVDVHVDLLGMRATLESGFTYGGSNDDRDDDGLVFPVEIFMGLNPDVFDSRDAFTLAVEGIVLKFTFRRAKGTTLEGVVQWSADLRAWNGEGFSESVVADMGAYELVEAQLSIVPGSRDARFVRLLVR